MCITSRVLTNSIPAGAPLQVSVRKSVDDMMYALTFCWLIQTILMGEQHSCLLVHAQLAPHPCPPLYQQRVCICTVYGTVVLAVFSPLCFDLARAGHMRNITRTMVAFIYAFTFGIA